MISKKKQSTSSSIHLIKDKHKMMTMITKPTSLSSSSKSFKSSIKKTTTTSRQDSSLSLLTEKFIQLIMKAKGEHIDLKQAAIDLNVKKRRIYDITNVLEGIQLIEKVSMNRVKWIGNKLRENKTMPSSLPSSSSSSYYYYDKKEKLNNLKKLNMELEMENQKLNDIYQTIQHYQTQTMNHPQCYLTKEDYDTFINSLSSSPITTTSLSSSSSSSSTSSSLHLESSPHFYPSHLPFKKSLPSTSTSTSSSSSSLNHYYNYPSSSSSVSLSLPLPNITSFTSSSSSNNNNNNNNSNNNSNTFSTSHHPLSLKSFVHE